MFQQRAVDTQKPPLLACLACLVFGWAPRRGSESCRRDKAVAYPPRRLNRLQKEFQAPLVPGLRPDRGSISLMAGTVSSKKVYTPSSPVLACLTLCSHFPLNPTLRAFFCLVSDVCLCLPLCSNLSLYLLYPRRAIHHHQSPRSKPP